MSRRASSDPPQASPPRRPAPAGSGPRRSRPERQAVGPGGAGRGPRSAPPAPAAEQRGSWAGLGGLFRGSGAVLGQLSGLEGPGRALERLATAAERAADHLDRLEAEVGIERVLDILDRVERAAEQVDEINRSLRQIETVVVDLHLRLAPPLDRLPLTRRRDRSIVLPDADGQAPAPPPPPGRRPRRGSPRLKG